jgi:hypothetical protein
LSAYAISDWKDFFVAEAAARSGLARPLDQHRDGAEARAWHVHVPSTGPGEHYAVNPHSDPRNGLFHGEPMGVT